MILDTNKGPQCIVCLTDRVRQLHSIVQRWGARA